MRKLRYKNHKSLVLLQSLNTHLEVKTNQLRFYSIIPGTKIQQGIHFPEVSYIDVLENWELGDLMTGEILPKYLSVLIRSRILKHRKWGRGRLKQIIKVRR